MGGPAQRKKNLQVAGKKKSVTFSAEYYYYYYCTQARSWPHFNVIYGTDSDSCAHEVEENWQLGNLGAVSKSAIAPLVETFLHLRLELHKLGGTFSTAKLPGHAGVYPMAAADACAKACHALRPADVQLVVHSTLVIPHAIPNNPATVLGAVALEQPLAADLLQAGSGEPQVA